MKTGTPNLGIYETSYSTYGCKRADSHLQVWGRALKRASGFTLIELIIVLAIIGILAAIGIGSVRPPEARLLANDYRAMVQQARFEAIKRNLPVAVVLNGQEYITLVKNDAAINCTTTNSAQLRVKRADEYRNVQISNVTGTGNGIVWLPTGLARNCSNTLPTGAGTATFSSGSSSVSVNISQAGRVTTQ